MMTRMPRTTASLVISGAFAGISSITGWLNVPKYKNSFNAIPIFVSYGNRRSATTHYFPCNTIYCIGFFGWKAASILNLDPGSAGGWFCGGDAGRKSAGNIDDGFWEYNSRSEEHTSELQSLMRISYAVFCL